jgi:S-methylmethionine-dependent homocysteine/selenocysteine methylase
VTATELRDWLGASPRVLDGAMGSELLRLGGQAAATLWGVGTLLEQPALIREVHRRYAEAGAEALATATFRIAPYSLRRIGLATRTAELAHLAVCLAREGAEQAGRGALVLASQTTLEDCYRPDLVPGDDVLAVEHRATAEALAAAGPDGLLLETFNTVREARIAAEAATATGLPVIVSFTCIPDGKLLSGENARAAAEAVVIPGVAAVGVNCTRVPDLLAALTRVAEGCTLPLVAYANNAWYDADSAWLEAQPLEPQRYAFCARGWLAAGARMVGGCCGTTPAHIAAVADMVRSAT